MIGALAASFFTHSSVELWSDSWLSLDICNQTAKATNHTRSNQLNPPIRINYNNHSNNHLIALQTWGISKMEQFFSLENVSTRDIFSNKYCFFFLFKLWWLWSVDNRILCYQGWSVIILVIDQLNSIETPLAAFTIIYCSPFVSRTAWYCSFSVYCCIIQDKFPCTSTHSPRWNV